MWSTLFLAVLTLPGSALASSFSFSTDPQTISPSTVSGAITISADAAVSATTCLLLSSNSSTGQFSSSATNWTPVSTVTMSRNSQNRTFYYQDTNAGSYTLTVAVAPKPDTVSTSCASWSDAASSVVSTITQSIIVGDNSSQDTGTASQTSVQTETQPSASSAAPVSSYVPPPVPQLFADAGSNREVIADADVEFDGRAYDRSQNVLDGTTARFSWNFGDGSTAEGPAVLHHFVYPGRYAVVLTVAHGSDSASSQIVVTAEPAQLAFSLLPSGGLSIQNLASRDLDLSNWIIAQQGRVITLPPHSVILSGASMQITSQALGFWSNTAAELQYPNGVLALHVGERAAGSTPSPVLHTSVVAAPVQSTSVSTSFPPSSPVAPSGPSSSRASVAPAASAAVPESSSTLAAAAAHSGVSVPLSLSLLGLVALVLLGAAGVWYVGSGSVGELHMGDPTDMDELADEFTIVSKESL